MQHMDGKPAQRQLHPLLQKDIRRNIFLLPGQVRIRKALVLIRQASGVFPVNIQGRAGQRFHLRRTHQMVVVPMREQDITHFFHRIALQIINQRLLARARIDHRRFPARLIEQDITIGRNRPHGKALNFHSLIPFLCTNLHEFPPAHAAQLQAHSSVSSRIVTGP